MPVPVPVPVSISWACVGARGCCVCAPVPVSVVVKFSRIVDGVPAYKMMNMLHELFHRYDLLCEKHGIFKVLPRIVVLVPVLNTDTAAKKRSLFHASSH